LEEPIQQRLATARVAADQLFWLKAVVGHVATAAAGDLHLGQHLACRFDDADPKRKRREFRRRDGAEKTGGSTTDTYDVEWLCHESVICKDRSRFKAAANSRVRKTARLPAGMSLNASGPSAAKRLCA